ncbi:hypothetical protein [Fundidesulfovibrio magnetotacticus]|uniref:hypothetical protein n=1 Tax=Fundidesulfovibrio magnetotacticus TaxID=2730080 RepID=UPI0015651D26|nr:hypothetical protein [Fundidesulfovibrio magnetotacticus]
MFILLAVSMLLLSVPNRCLAGEPEELKEIALRIKAMVEKEDTKGLVASIADTIWFVDDPLSRKQVARLLANKKSWLYKHLFVGDESIRSYLLKADDITIEFHRLSEKAWSISYVSQKTYTRSVPGLTFMKNGKGWLLVSLFSNG